MTQTITTRRESVRIRHLWSYGLILMFLLSGYSGLQAQTVSWTTGYPKLTPSILTAMGDPGYLDVYFTPTVAAISTAKLEVKLPANVSYVSAENGIGHNASVTYSTPVATGTVAAGQTVTVSFTSNSNTLKVGEAVSLRLKVTANCSAVSGSTATVKVLSNTTLITSGQKTVTIGVQIPTIRVQCTTPTQNYSTQAELKEFELLLDAQNGTANSFKLTLTGDQYATLSDFTLDGTSITVPAGSLNILSGSTTVTTITINNPSEMGGSALGTIVKKLKFKAASSRCGARNISTSVQYPATSNCNTQTGVTLTMSFPSEAGVPFISYVSASAGYYNGVNGSAISIYQAPKDLVTPTYLKISYKNTGSADAYDMNIPSLGMYEERGSFGFIDEQNIQYSIDGGTLKTLSSTQAIGSAKVGNTAASGFVLPQYANKNFRANVTIPEVVPVNSTITLWVPAYLGKIYDNTDKNAYMDYFTRANWGMMGNATAKNRCSVQGSGTVAQNYIAWSYDPFFREIPSPVVVKANDIFTQQVRMAASGLSSNASTYSSIKIFIEMPEWLDLNGAIEDAIKIKTIDGATTKLAISGSGEDLGVSGGKRTYSLSFTDLSSSYSNVYLTIDYKAGVCQSSTENMEGKIRYWLDWQYGSPAANNPPLTMSSQVFQNITMLCKLDGVVLDDFTINRTTVGLKDSGNDSNPDDGSPALASEINHNYYLLDDKGYLKWDATISGPATDTYTHWYAPVTLTTVNLTQIVPQSAAASIRINNGASTSVTYVKLDNNRFYLHYDGTVVPLKGGDKIEIILPFDIKATNDQLYSLKTECFVSNVVFSAPFSSAGSTDRHGDDIAIESIGIYSDNAVKTFDSSYPTFTNNNVQTNKYYGFFDYYYNSYPTGFFKNEVRRKYYPTKLVFELPEGYIFTDNLRMTYTKLDLPTSATQNLAPSSAIESTYTYDIASLFDETYDGSGILASGKFMIPDDKWREALYISTRATKGAQLGNSVGKWTVTYKNVNTGVETQYSSSANFSYSGTATTLNLSTTTLPAYGSRLSIPVVTVGNPNQMDINNVWLYVDGNVSNLSIIPQNGGAAINSTGSVGRWIKVSDLMTAGSTLSYKLSFTYGGSNDCTVTDKIKIYTVSGFDDPTWDPVANGAVNAALNLTDYDHVGANKSVSITSAPATISGDISVSSSVLTFNTPYTVTVSMDALSSPGALKDPQIKLTIPAGQKYIAGSVKVEYPIGSTAVANATLDALLSALSYTADSEVTLNIGSNFLLAGYLGEGSDADREVRITADFSPQCETVLTGIRFHGTLSGSTACGDAAKGNGTDVFSSQMFPNIAGGYSFTATSAMVGGNNAFNEGKTTGTLQITLLKISGPTDNMLLTDSLLVTLPKEFDLASSVAISSGIGTGAVTIGSNVVSGSDRVIHLSLPVSAYNAAANKGVNQNVIYDLPLVYTPDDQSLALNPEQTVSVVVMTNKRFDVTCPNAPAAIGNVTHDMAVVTAAAAPFLVCANTASDLEITSSGFSGSWHATSSCTGTALSTSSICTSTMHCDSTLYVTAIFNSINYGIVPVAVEVNEEATITVTTPTAQCSTSSSVDLTSTVSGTPTGSTVKYYSDAAGATELTGAGLTVTPTVTTTYYAQVTTTDGCTSDMTPIVVTVNLTPAVTAPTAQTVCVGAATSIALTGTNATHFTWTGGSSIGLVDEDGTTPKIAIPSFTAVNATSAPVSVTITVTPQNTANSITCAGTPVTFTITVNPTPVAGTVSNSSVCSGLSHGAITPSVGTAVTYYTWSGGSSVGLADYTATDKTTIPAFTASTVTTATTATITVVPHYVNGTVTCDGTAVTFTVTVNPLPVVTLVTNQTNDEVCVNTDITFTTELGMSAYVWNLGGATVTTSGGNATSNTSVLQWNSAGTKTVTVNYTDANGCTATASTSKSATILPATVITTSPTVDASILIPFTNYIIPGSNVDLDVVATGSSLTYQWYKDVSGTVTTLTDGGKYSGTTSANLQIANAYDTENGEYYVTVTGACGAVTSTPVTVVAVANQDASLKDLKVNGITLPDFNPAKTDYMTTVVCNDEQVIILGTPNNVGATVAGNGTFSLQPGDNIFTLTVTAQDLTTKRYYTVNVIRDCYVPKILKDLEDAVICVGDTHTFEIEVDGQGLTYEWYYGLNRIMGANTNTYTVTTAELRDYERYQVVIRSNYNGFKSSAYSKKVRLWVADYLPMNLRFATCPSPATTGSTYHIKVDGYIDVTKYTWSYDKEGVTFSPGADQKWSNEAWATFGTLSAGTGTLKVTMEHPCGARELTKVITVKYPTGTDDVTAEVVQVYPNPTSGVLKVLGTEANQTIRVTDVAGSTKGIYKTQEGTTKIDLTGYAKGTYMVQYNGKTYKVIKK